MASKPQLTPIRTAPSHSNRAHPYPPPARTSFGSLPSPHDSPPASAADDAADPSTQTTRSRAQTRTKAKPPSSAGRNAQPKSTRKQFSACGSCQLRQVKCDLKDRIVNDGEAASCTACAERGLNCLPVYPPDAKPKAQRRGRRLLVVEKYYGKSTGKGGNVDVKAVLNTLAAGPGNNTNVAGPSSSNLPSSSRILASDKNSLSLPSASSLAAPQKSCIPPLHPDFFQSPFYRSFHTQRPIVDPTEFRERFMASLQGRSEALGPIGALIAMILVTWAASYGVDECGREDAILADASGVENLAAVRERRSRCKTMVKEMLDIIDQYALLRKPSWDGVRVLMLIMPLTEDSLNPVDRLSMYQSTISQIYNLCTLGTSLQQSGAYNPDKMVVARIFWYAYVHEGITSGLRGRKLIFDDDDLRVFESTLPRVRAGGEGGMALTSRPVNDHFAFRFSTAPIRLSTACRQINYALTGPRAMLRNNVDEKRLTEGWETLSACWLEFEELRSELDTGASTFMQKTDMERFISGWQIFLFECHNVIRESLKEKAIERDIAIRAPQVFVVGEPVPERQQQTNVNKLLQLAESHCRELHTRVMQLIRQQLNSERFFQYDASLVRDGTFYAGNWACYEAENEADVEACIRALEKMRWAFSSGEARIATLRFAWRTRHTADKTQGGWYSTRTSPEGQPLRNPELLTDLHLPLGPGQIVGVGQDAFEHYVYEKNANVFADEGLSSSKSFHASGKWSNDQLHIASGSGSRFGSGYHTPPESLQLAPLENLEHANATTSAYGRDDSPWDALQQPMSSMPNSIPASKHRRSSSARSFGGGSPRTPSVGGGSSYSGPSSFPITPDPSHPPQSSFFGAPQPPAPQHPQSSSSSFDRSGSGHQRQDFDPGWLPSSSSGSRLLEHPLEPLPSPPSQLHHHSQHYGGPLAHDSHLYNLNPGQQQQQQHHQSSQHRVQSLSSTFALHDTPILRSDPLHHQSYPNTSSSSRNNNHNSRRDYDDTHGFSLPSLSSSTPDLHSLHNWPSTNANTGPVSHHMGSSPSSNGSTNSLRAGPSTYDAYTHPSHPQQHSFNHHNHPRGSLKHHASMDETQLVNPTRYPAEFSHIDTPWHR